MAIILIRKFLYNNYKKHMLYKIFDNYYNNKKDKRNKELL